MKVEIDIRDSLFDYLKCWKDEGIPAPVNELQSIAAWLGETSDVEAMREKMRKRMVILMNLAGALHEKGIDAEVMAGIFANRPDLEAAAREVASKAS